MIELKPGALQADAVDIDSATGGQELDRAICGTAERSERITSAPADRRQPRDLTGGLTTTGELLTAELQPIDVESCPPPHRDDRLVAGADHLERLTVLAAYRCSLSRIALPDRHKVDACESQTDRTDLIEPLTASSRHADQHVRAVAIDSGWNEHRPTARRLRVSSRSTSRPECLGGDGVRREAERHEAQERARSDEHHRGRAEDVHERFSMVDGTERSRQGAGGPRSPSAATAG